MNESKTLVLLILVFISCGNPTDDNHGSYQDFSYAPIHVGDIHQLSNEIDSLANLSIVIGKTLRKDSQEVFVEVESYESFSDTFYLFIRDSFCIYSAIDTIKDSAGKYDSLNPFGETKYCLERPIVGYSWYPYRGSYCCYSYVNKYTTFAGTFNEVFVIERYFHIDTAYILRMKNYFGKNIGFIGTETIDSTGSVERRFLLSYAKIDGREYGHLFPAKSYNGKKVLSINDKMLPLKMKGLYPFYR